MRVFADHDKDATDNILKFYEFEKFYHAKSKMKDIDHPCTLLQEDDK